MPAEAAEAGLRARWATVGDPDWPTTNAPERVAAPAWLDPSRCDRAGLTLRRHGLLTSAVLRSYALPLSYLSPSGVRPLLFTGELVDHAGPRLYRTAAYVLQTHAPGAMHPDGAAWATAATVRTMHQRTRQQLRDRGWPHPEAPLPQPDLAATALLFGPLVVDGLRHLGADLSEAEADDVAHLARAMAHGQGVVPELQADTHAEAMALFGELTADDTTPCDGGRRLMDALLGISHQLARTPLDRAMAPGLRALYRSLSVHLLGPGPARALGLRGRGRLGRSLGWLTRMPLYGRRAAPVHDAAVRWVMRRGEARMHPSGPVKRSPAARSTAARPSAPRPAPAPAG